MIKYKKVIVSTLLLFVFFSSQNIINNISIKTYSLFKITKDISGTISVPGNNYCINNGFNKLGDCMLIMENYSASVDKAKNYIESKGTATYNEIAPTILFVEKINEVEDENGVERTNSHFTLSKSYVFNQMNGKFQLGEYNDSGEFEEKYVNDVLNDNYINYYTCGHTQTTTATCPTIYQIKEYKITTDETTTTYYITKAIQHIYENADSFDSETGLYMAEDDLGKSYFYRGNVLNNYVSYAGFIWQIVRQNGDGSIRLIYLGTTTNDNEENTSIDIGTYNISPSDPTYLGYMYNKNFTLNTTKNTQANFVRFTENTAYYFADNYKFNSTTGEFSLTGNMTSGTWKSKYSTIIDKYPYTCLKTTSLETCEFIFKASKYVNAYTMNGKIISYSSTDYSSTLKNTTDSSIKEKIDTWYENNILNKTDSKGNKYSTYLSDEIFCGDRNIYSGSGYLLSPSTYYSSYNRLYNNRQPTLKCTQTEDKFTTKTTIGNGNLKYPIGLLTADESSMAGGLVNTVNNKYYLHTGQTYWTMTPSYFGTNYVYGRIWAINDSGELRYTYSMTNKTFGIRPVVNLSKDIVITSGDGSAEKPYIVALSTLK